MSGGNLPEAFAQKEPNLQRRKTAKMPARKGHARRRRATNGTRMGSWVFSDASDGSFAAKRLCRATLSGSPNARSRREPSARGREGSTEKGGAAYEDGHALRRKRRLLAGRVVPETSDWKGGPSSTGCLDSASLPRSSPPRFHVVLSILFRRHESDPYPPTIGCYLCEPSKLPAPCPWSPVFGPLRT
jgi:hypothetical protein